MQLDGSTVVTDASPATWTTFSTTLNVATPGNHTLAFAAVLGAGDTATGLDNVAINVPQGGGLSASSAVQLTTTGASLDLDGFSATIASLTGVAGSTVTLGGGALTTGGDGTSTLYAGNISDLGGASPNTGGSLVKTGAGMMTLSGANTYSGGTTLAGGVLSLGSSGAIGSSGTISFTGGTLQFSSVNTTDYSGRFSNAANQAYSIDTNGQSLTFASPLSSAGGTLTVFGGGTVTLTANNTFTGATTITSSTLQLGDGTTNNGAVAGNIIHQQRQLGVRQSEPAAVLRRAPSPARVTSPRPGGGRVDPHGIRTAMEVERSFPAEL